MIRARIKWYKPYIQQLRSVVLSRVEDVLRCSAGEPMNTSPVRTSFFLGHDPEGNVFGAMTDDR